MKQLDNEPVELPNLGSRHDELWTVLCDLGDAVNENWTIIGGQMVMLLHAPQTGRSPSRVSEDLDTVIDTRVRPPALASFLATLHDLGFRSAGVSPDDVAHRFARDTVHIDVLGPDGLGQRVDLRTVGNATTIEVRGGTQALERSERLAVSYRGRVAFVPRPNLLGAIIIKSAAVNNDPNPRRHIRDCVPLLTRERANVLARTHDTQGPATASGSQTAPRPQSRSMESPRRRRTRLHRIQPAARHHSLRAAMRLPTRRRELDAA
jgi:hypothetical protein